MSYTFYQLMRRYLESSIGEFTIENTNYDKVGMCGDGQYVNCHIIRIKSETSNMKCKLCNRKHKIPSYSLLLKYDLPITGGRWIINLKCNYNKNKEINVIDDFSLIMTVRNIVDINLYFPNVWA